jgi:outer membrane receptor for ferrienterochelin and colicins
MHTPVLVFLLTMGTVLVPAALQAQEPERPPINFEQVYVTGRVVDQTTRRAIGFARVSFHTPGPEGRLVWGGVARSTGQFEIDQVPAGRYEVRVEGLAYSPLSHVVDLGERNTLDLQIELAPEALALEGIVVTGIRRSRLEMSGFFERREQGFGTTLNREEIESRNSNCASDIFYGIAGARVVQPRGLGQSAQVLLRGGCVPQLVLDGAPFARPIPIDEVVRVHEIEAIEVYHGPSGPVRYASSSCGTIMVWTREASSMEGAPFSWKRLAAATGLVGLAYLMGR